MIRALYLGFNVEYMNPSQTVLRDALSKTVELIRFGPGFVEPGIVRNGVEAFYEAHGPFDAVVADEFTLQEMNTDGVGRTKFTNHACSFDRRELIRVLDYRQFLRDVDCIRVIALMQIDHYCMPENRLKYCDDYFDFVIGTGEEFIAERPQALADFETVSGLSPVDWDIQANWSDRYLEFVRRNAGRIVSTPLPVGDDEFYNGPLARRRYPWVAIGADYTERLAARAALDVAGIARAAHRHGYMFAAFYRLGINPFAYRWTVDLMQGYFRRALRTSRYGYTCGSIAKCVIRKFFEIPAAGCVLVADPCEGFEALGFRDGENAIVAHGGDLPEVHKMLTRQDDLGQRIADAGRDLVRRQHSATVRARQLAAAFEAILQNDFAGSRWVSGEFRIRVKNGQEVTV